MKVLIVICLGFAVFSPAQNPAGADHWDRLNRQFRESYRMAGEQTLASWKKEGPVLVNDFLNMWLFIPGKDEPIRFRMDKDRYMRLARVSHIPLTLYSMISPNGFGPEMSWVLLPRK